MLTEKYVIKFQGFILADETRLLLENKLRETFSKFPERTICSLVFSKKDDQCKGVATIHFPEGRVIAIAKDEKLEFVVSKLVKKIKKHLSRYKMPRLHRRNLINELMKSEYDLQQAS